jgi:hypothetical protein
MSSFNAGQTTAGASSGAFSGLTGNQITLSQSGVLQSATIFFAGVSGVSFYLGIYDDNINNPNNLLAQSVLGTTNGTTQTLLMTTNPTLAPGKYWVVVQNQNPVNGHFDSGAGLGYFMGTPVWDGIHMPNPAPSSSTGAFTFSLYATFNTVAVPTFPVTIDDISTVITLGFHKTVPVIVTPPTVITDPKRETRPILVAPSGIGVNQTTKIVTASAMPPWEIGPIPGVLVGNGLNQTTKIVMAYPMPPWEGGMKRL